MHPSRLPSLLSRVIYGVGGGGGVQGLCSWKEPYQCRHLNLAFVSKFSVESLQSLTNKPKRFSQLDIAVS